MNEIKVAENKTLKLTNVLSREIRPEEMASLPVVLTQMHNFIKSNNAQPIGPIIQSFALGEDHQMHLYMMQQATQLIPQMDPGYHMDASCASRTACTPTTPAPWKTASWPPTSCRSTLLKTTRS